MDPRTTDRTEKYPPRGEQSVSIRAQRGSLRHQVTGRAASELLRREPRHAEAIR